ncbi:minor capsid protein [Salmonella enterica]|nr:minor capsid protein [Salmonella enterica]
MMFPDMTESDVRNALDELAADITENNADVEAAIAAFMTLVFGFAVSAYKYHTRQFIRMAKQTGGTNNRYVILLIGGAYGNMNEPWFNSKYITWRSLIEASVRKFAYNVLDDWEVQQKLNELREQQETKAQIRKRLQKYKSWAKNRAAGFVGSWYSVLMYQRVVDAGVTHYIWRTQQDNRVRPEHAKLNMKRIALIAKHIFPGQEYNCRCYAIPDWRTSNELV